MSCSAAPSTHPARAVREALDAVRSASTILEALRRAAAVAAASSDDHAGASRHELRLAADDRSDAVTALAAVHALGALPVADTATLVRLLASGDPFRIEHAAWALGRSAPRADAAALLVDLVAAGGVTGMLAQRTLELWAPRAPEVVLAALAAGLEARAGLGADLGQDLTVESRPHGGPHPQRDPQPRPDADTDTDTQRTRLVETVGLVPGAAATALLLGVVDDDTEALATVAAATAALGDWFTSRPRKGAGQRGRSHAAYPGLTGSGLTVVQLFLHADIDGELSSAGKGDTGGIATLLVHLGNALLESGRGVDRVVTISRGRPGDEPFPDDLAAPGHHYAQVPMWGPRLGMADAWMHRIAVLRGVRRILRAAGPVDAIHLRMGDVGSFAAAEAARELGVPIVFTVAPDPQALLASREASGDLTRESFAAADALEHLMFRDHLVRALAREADQLVLFPRPALARDSRELLGLDLAVEGLRATVVAEGIDFRAVDRASAAQKRAVTQAGAGPAGPAGGTSRAAGAGPAGGTSGAAGAGPAAGVGGARRDGPPRHEADAVDQAVAELDALLGALPTGRRHLPLAITVGRLNRVKGMGALVETWRRTAGLHTRCNLLVVGGDLDDPSGDEAAELARIDAAVPRAFAAGQGLLLPGHRPHGTVAVWQAATLRGRPGLAGPAGVYVSASLKEEFGLAILEAMAASLVVVAPDGGGPATYVEPDVTGVLCDTASPTALAEAIGRALDMAASPETAMHQRRALTTLRDRFSITTMAGALSTVYVSASHDRVGTRDTNHAPPAGAAS